MSFKLKYFNPKWANLFQHPVSLYRIILKNNCYMVIGNRRVVKRNSYHISQCFFPSLRKIINFNALTCSNSRVSESFFTLNVNTSVTHIKFFHANVAQGSIISKPFKEFCSNKCEKIYNIKVSYPRIIKILFVL